MLTIHHLGISASERIVWLCEELALPYELLRYERDPETRQAPPAYRALHPAGTAPVITDGPVTLAESGAIIEYVLARYGGGRLALAADDPDLPDALFWFHYANGSLMPRGMMEMVAHRIAGPEAGAMLGQRSAAAWAMVDDYLGRRPFFAGRSFGAADIMMVFTLTTMRSFLPRDITGYANILAYLARIGERPAYQRAMVRADPGLPLRLT